jgi:hypothetical protein
VKVEFHPDVEEDVAEALEHYDAVSQRLGDEFKAELSRFINVAAARPGSFIWLKGIIVAQT